VYLDEVSVYSLIASRLGAVTAELTESQSSTLTTESGADLELTVPPAAKAKATSKVQGSNTRGTQILRKATVQSTFKQLLEVEERLVSPPPAPDVAPFASWQSMKSEAQRSKGTPWLIDSASLQRGELIEVLVEVAVDPVYRVSSIIDTMTELLDEYPAMVPPAIHTQVEQARVMNRILDKFMVGLVPIRCKMLNYQCIEIEGREFMVHQRALDGLSQAERPDAKELFVVGATDEQLYWKDLRRILFSDSRFTVLCRIDRQGIRRSWTPVKLVDVLEAAIPDLPNQMETMGQRALEAMANATASSPDRRVEHQRKVALVEYGRRLVASQGSTLSEPVVAAVEVAAEIGAERFDSIDTRRSAFSAVEAAVERDLASSVDSTSAADLRMDSLASAGLAADGSLLPLPTPTPPSHAGGDRRVIETEIIAMYW